MWFRFSGGGSTTDLSTDNPDTCNNNNNNEAMSSETVKPFEKFRRASFRRKSGSAKNNPAPAKRSNSPHSLLSNDKVLSETSKVEILDRSSDGDDHIDGEKVSKVKPKKMNNHMEKLTEESELEEKMENGKYTFRNEVKIPINSFANKQLKLSKEKLVVPEENKQQKMKMKNPKAKNSKKTMPKNSSTNIANSMPSAMPPLNNNKEQSPNISSKTQRFFSAFGLMDNKKSFDLDDHMETNDNNDDDSSDSSNSSDSDASDNCLCDEDDKEDNLPLRGKDKLLLIDPKYRNNRIEKSSSKTKIVDFEKRESIKRSRSARKIMAPQSSSGGNVLDSSFKGKAKARDKSSTKVPPQNEKQRPQTNLNLQSLVKFVMNNKKFVNNEDCALMRRKSIADAVSSVMAMASSCKQMPIALKYPQAGIVADTPKENDMKAERNVVLVKKQNLHDSFRNSLRLKKTPSIEKTTNKDDSKIKRNESISSRSSGNFEDEAFYSCDENENKKSIDSDKYPVIEENSSSPLPSLTSRVAAKFSEKTSLYKSRRAAKKRKKSKDKIAAEDDDKVKEVYRKNSPDRLQAASIVRQPSDRRPDVSGTSIRSNGNSSGVHNSSDLQSSLNASGNTENLGCGNSSVTDSSTSTVPLIGNTAGCAANNNNSVVDPSLQDVAEGKDPRRERYTHQHNKSAPVSVNRSESYKERLSNKRNRNSRRKTSDPNLSSRPADEQADVGLSNSNYNASSNSSPSPGASSESLSTSMEHVGSATTPIGNVSIAHHHGHQDSFHGSIGSAGSNNISFWGGNNSIGETGQPPRPGTYESDEEDDLFEADWSSMVAADLLSTLTDAEKKRQEIINEIYQTERSHVRTLKLLDRLFFRPLQSNGLLSQDHLMLLFPPALTSLCDLHGSFELKLKQRRLEHNHVVSHIGDLLASMFDGPAGEELREHAAQFCARQQIALEALKEKRRKDEQLHKLLSKSESHKACRRLQLKDLLPTVLQRLTKYPLLFENLYKVTIRVLPEDTNEAESIQQALESSKKILVDVNQAVKTAEDAHKLQNIQKKLDKSTFDKDEFKNLDLTQHKLIYDGNLTMKKNPSIQLHGLLFENMIVLLTKQDDKYSLKYLQVTRNVEVNNKPVSPIMSIDSETLVRQEAADKNSFFLIKTKTSQMLELRAPSSSDCKTWFKHISDAAEQYKPRSKNVNQESVDDPAIATLPHSNTKESLELTPERVPPQTATATVITTPLAPFTPPQISSSSNKNEDNAVNVQNGPNAASSTDPHEGHEYYNIGKNRFNHNESLLQTPSNAVNRTMSTRSCGEPNSTHSADSSLNTSNITLRHTQSARQANSNTPHNPNDEFSKRDSTSIVYSNNSNDTRTLLMQSPLVQPTAIQISISPAHTAEPVLTPAERLRRLDVSIKDGLLEKQKIICDMFRVPYEHFDEIVDIASMPEAPKDSADIALAAYEQVQSLTKVINEYLHVTPEQVISAVSTSLCDKCNEKQNNNQTPPSHGICKTNSKPSQSAAVSTALDPNPDVPPPLPPPNKQTSQTHLQMPRPPPPKQTETVLKQMPNNIVVDDSQILEDDDGYCEIDELRLPAISPSPVIKSGSAPPLLPPAGKMKGLPPPPPPPPPPSLNKKPLPKPEPPLVSSTEVSSAAEQCLVESIEKTEVMPKRQSIIIEESIPDDDDDKLSDDDDKTKETNETKPDSGSQIEVLNGNLNIEEDVKPKNEKNEKDMKSKNEIISEPYSEDDISPDKNNQATSQEIDSNAIISKPEISKEINKSQENSNEEQNNEDVKETIPKMVDGSTQTLPPTSIAMNDLRATMQNSLQCGANRLQHVNSLEPRVPCNLLYNIVSALNEHISLLLPKLNERDLEREQLRKENQHLRELLNAMHERQRVNQDEETLKKSNEEKPAEDCSLATNQNSSEEVEGNLKDDVKSKEDPEPVEKNQSNQ